MRLIKKFFGCCGGAPDTTGHAEKIISAVGGFIGILLAGVEAINSHHPYRPGLGIGAALGKITRSRGTHYYQQVVDTCLRLFRKKGYEFSV
jgi:hypothetical protein